MKWSSLLHLRSWRFGSCLRRCTPHRRTGACPWRAAARQAWATTIFASIWRWRAACAQPRLLNHHHTTATHCHPLGSYLISLRSRLISHDLATISHLPYQSLSSYRRLLSLGSVSRSNGGWPKCRCEVACEVSRAGTGEIEGDIVTVDRDHSAFLCCI